MVLIKLSRVIDGIGLDPLMLDRALGNLTSSRMKSVYTAMGPFSRIRKQVFKVEGQASIYDDLDAVNSIMRLYPTLGAVRAASLSHDAGAVAAVRRSQLAIRRAPPPPAAAVQQATRRGLHPQQSQHRPLQ